MRIGIDYTAAVRQRAGIGRYTRNLIRALATLDAENRYELFVAGRYGRRGDGLGAWPLNFRVRSVPVSDRWTTILWQRLRLPVPIQLLTGGLDLFHSPDFVLPFVGQTPAILTVHDLSFLRVPHCFVPGFCEYLKTSVERAVRRSRWILADSESTQRDLVELLGVDPACVSVVYPGVEERFRRVVDPLLLDEVRRRYALPAEFILGLGTLQPRKNMTGLVEGFARVLAARGADPGFQDLHLVLTGDKGWMYEDIYRAVRDGGLEQRVRFTGFVADADLPALYTLATAFAFPSWYEGFGLPVLEAMACGTPVVASDTSSLPEVVGHAGLLVSPANADDLPEALARIVDDASLRGRLGEEGAVRARQFKWETAAAQTLHLYGKLAPKQPLPFSRSE